MGDIEFKKEREFGHYTTIAGLKGIIENQELWATNLKFLNDEQEFQYTVDMAKGIIGERSKLELWSPEYRRFLTNALESLHVFTVEALFSLSFSAEMDLLSQWRGYCPGNNGYCVIFDVAEVFRAIRAKHGENAHWFNCVYEESECRKFLIDELESGWLEFCDLENDEEKEKLVAQMRKQIVLFSAHFKHPSFKEEKERRIVVQLPFALNGDDPDEFSPYKGIEFREGKSSLIPYIRLPVDKKMIKRIIIGPSFNKELSELALTAFLEKHYGWTHFSLGPEIELSKVPYRSW